MTSSTATTRRPAFVATTGGHLVQLYLMSSVLEPERHRDGLWITHRTPQSESMLRGHRVEFVDPVEARDWLTVLRRTPTVLAAMRRHGVDRVYSTGAALALVALPGSRLAGVRPKYIESLARPSGPSLAGRVLARLPWVPVFTQYPQNAGGRWRYEHSLLDSFRPEPVAAPQVPRRILVTLGTAGPWGFRSLLERVLEIAPPDAEIIWQTGVTDVGGLPIDARAMMSDADFVAEHLGLADAAAAVERAVAGDLAERGDRVRTTAEVGQDLAARVAG